ncbi:MAG: sigma-70 family RNA polymerase sigma factor [Myxococcales bacterium]|nr:sigma-70 family RNA polymerase sigma factor [Myxococcales bacterium]
MTQPVSTTEDAELYRKYRPKVFDLLVRRLRNVEEAEALAQEAMLRALQASKTKPIRSFGAFAMRIAHNLATDVLRRRRFEGGWVDPESALVVDPKPEQVELFRLRGLVEVLPPRYRQIILLRYEKGLSFAEIARSLDMSKNGAFARHERALDMLRESFGKRRR